MSNKSLNTKYGIPFLSEWEHKDGGRYIALLVEHSFKNSKIPIVCYKKILTEKEQKEWIENKIKNQFVRTVEHFKNSFTFIEYESIEDYR